MTLHDFFFYGYQAFATFFVLGCAAAIIDLEQEDDDDDDQDGGILQPAYASVRR